MTALITSHIGVINVACIMPLHALVLLASREQNYISSCNIV